jgi:hypothetical protein
MASPVSDAPPPSRIPLGAALRHFVVAGLLAGILGVVFSALVFYLLVLGLLYAEQPVHGANQVPLPIPHLPEIVLSPPLFALDLNPPPGKREEGFDSDYLGACARLIGEATWREDVGLTLLAWAAVTVAAALALGIVGLLIRLLLGARAGPFFGILALLVALAAMTLLVGCFRFHWQLPLDLDVPGRLVVYAAVALTGAIWITIVGFRFRAILLPVVTVLVGEALVFGLPPPVWTTTALWHFSLFLMVPTGYAWLVVERGEQKRVIAA